MVRVVEKRETNIKKAITQSGEKSKYCIKDLNKMSKSELIKLVLNYKAHYSHQLNINNELRLELLYYYRGENKLAKHVRK